MNPYTIIMQAIEEKGSIYSITDDLNQQVKSYSHKIQVMEAELSYLQSYIKLAENSFPIYSPLMKSTWENAHQALMSITKFEHYEIYSYQKPPKIMKTLMKGIPILLGCRNPSWDKYREMVKRKDFWDVLYTIKLTPKMLENIKPIIDEFEGNNKKREVHPFGLYKWYGWMKNLYKFSQAELQIPSKQMIQTEIDIKSQNIDILREKLVSVINSEIEIRKILERIS